MKRTAIYIRVSSYRQTQDGDSIPAQRDALRKYIDNRDDLIFTDEYLDDGISGTKYSQRDELQRLLDDVRAGKIDQILFVKLDRWFRSVRHYTSTQAILDKYNVGWTAIWEPIYDTTTPQGRLIVNQMMSIAQFEAENTGQRIRQVQAYKITQGEVISGSCPHGYSIKDKHLVPNEYATNVLLAYETFLRVGSIGGTMVAMSEVEGLPRLQRGFKKMLSNPVYIGEYRGNKNFCEPIIPRQVWDRVQDLLPKNIKTNQKHDYLFSGIIRCADCGCSFAALTRRRNRGGGVKAEKMYRCPKHFQRRPAQCGNTKVLSEGPLERYLTNNINDLISNVIVEYEQGPPRDHREKIAAIERKITRLKDLYINGLITLDEYKADKTAFTARIEELRRDQDKTPAVDLDALKRLNGADFVHIYATLDRTEKRRLWRGIIKEIQFDSNRDIKVIFL